MASVTATDAHEVGDGVGNEGLYLLHVLLHRLLDGSRRGAVQVAQRQPSYVLCYPYAQPIEHVERRHVARHQCQV